MCIVTPSANGLGISLGFTTFLMNNMPILLSPLNTADKRSLDFALFKTASSDIVQERHSKFGVKPVKPVKPCPHCRLPFSATVAVFCDSRRFR